LGSKTRDLGIEPFSVTTDGGSDRKFETKLQDAVRMGTVSIHHILKVSMHHKLLVCSNELSSCWVVVTPAKMSYFTEKQAASLN